MNLKIITGATFCALTCAGAWALLPLGLPDENAAANGWLVTARSRSRHTTPSAAPMHPLASLSSPNPSSEPPSPEHPPMDPFHLHQLQREHDQATIKAPVAAKEREDTAPDNPADRLAGLHFAGTLRRDETTHAIVQIGGLAYRIGAGDELPNHLGRVLRVDQDRLELATDGGVRTFSLQNVPSRPPLPRVTPAGRHRNPFPGGES